MNITLKPRTLSLIAGVSYLVIFFAGVFANFFVIDSMLTDPLKTVQQEHFLVRAGILAFLITAVLDVVVAWALYGLFREHALSGLSALFRVLHAVILGVAIFALPMALASTTGEEVLRQVDIFNTIWLIGLFFFGIHLLLLGKIIGRPKVIAIFIMIAGMMYMLDTASHFGFPDYEAYSSVFLAFVAVPSLLGELSFTFWLLVKGGKE